MKVNGLPEKLLCQICDILDKSGRWECLAKLLKLEHLIRHNLISSAKGVIQNIHVSVFAFEKNSTINYNCCESNLILILFFVRFLQEDDDNVEAFRNYLAEVKELKAVSIMDDYLLNQ